MQYEHQQYLVAIFFFMIIICFVLAWFFWQNARHREMMLMIEKGMDPADHRNKSVKMLRTIGIILIGIGAGAAIHNTILSLGFKGINTDGGTLGVFGLSIGIALYFATRPEQTKEK